MQIDGTIPTKNCDDSKSELSSLLDEGHALIKDGVIFNIQEKLWMAKEFYACMISMDKLSTAPHK